MLPFSEIIERLDIIKHYIALADIEGVSNEMVKLGVYAFYDEVHQLILQLERQEYASALVAIADFQNKYQSYSDDEKKQLKDKVGWLEHQLNLAWHKKNALEATLEAFYDKHNAYLGWYICRILHLKLCLTKNNPKQYQKLLSQNVGYTAALKKAQTYNPKATLDQVYRALNKYVLKNHHQNDALNALSQAYENMDGKEARRILAAATTDKLWQGVLDDLPALEAVLERLDAELKALNMSIDEIQGSTYYQRISAINDVDVYFKKIRKKLVDEVDYLEACLAKVV